MLTRMLFGRPAGRPGMTNIFGAACLALLSIGAVAAGAVSLGLLGFGVALVFLVI